MGDTFNLVHQVSYVLPGLIYLPPHWVEPVSIKRPLMRSFCGWTILGAGTGLASKSSWFSQQLNTTSGIINVSVNGGAIVYDRRLDNEAQL